MLGFLGYWQQEARGLYRQVPEGEDVSNGEKHDFPQPSSLPFIIQKIYQVAPFLLLLNLVLAAMWTVQGLSHIFKRPKTFPPERKV